MATTTLLQRHAGEGETIAEAIRDCLDYGKDPEKTESGKYISAYECDPATVADEFLLAKAIPKISVTAPEKTVKHINERKETGEIAGTEPERRQRSKSGQTEKPAVRKTKTASKVKRPKSPAVQRPTRVGGNTDEILLAQSLKEELDIQSIVENELNSDNK